jgi:tRNA pseudouridine38-40 synthase
MVRKIVGILIETGLGLVKTEEIPNIIKSKERSQSGMLADPCGLYLEKIIYPMS